MIVLTKEEFIAFYKKHGFNLLAEREYRYSIVEMPNVDNAVRQLEFERAIKDAEIVHGKEFSEFFSTFNLLQRQVPYGETRKQCVYWVHDLSWNSAYERYHWWATKRHEAY